MSITIAPRLEAKIQKQVSGGRYRDADQVIEQALLLLEERDRFEALRAELAIGLEQIERGETVPYTPDLMDRLKRGAAEAVRLGKPIKDAVKP
jgi:antitoxin ParD1/3/4